MTSDSPDDVDALKARAGRATAWMIFGYGGGNLLRLASNLILTRLLLAEHFGVMALVNIFVTGLQLFSDIGIGPAIIQSKQGEDPKLLNTAWTISVLRGFALWGIACLATAPLASFYEQKELLYLIPVVSLNAVLAGFRSSKTFTQNRNLALGRVVAIDLASQIVAAVVMIAWAYITRSLWALAAGALVRVFVHSVLSHTALPGVANRFRWDREAAKSLFSFGRWIFVSTALTFITMHADRLIFGRLVSMTELGVYSIAVVITTAPATLLSQLSRSIVFPIYSRADQAGEDLAEIYTQAREPMLVLGGWGLAALIVAGPSLVQLLYEPAYWPAGWMTQLLAAGMWFGIVLEGTNGNALLAQGLAQWTAASSLGKVVGLCVLLPIGYGFGGFPGAVAGLAGSEFCRYLVSTYAARRRKLYGLRQDLKTTALIAVSVAFGSAVGWGVRLEFTSPLLELIATLLAATAVWSPVLLPYAREYLGRRRLVSSGTPSIPGSAGGP